MPLFEFRCSECGAEFEKLVRRAGVYEGVVCPVCGSGTIEELLSTFALPAKNASAGSQAAKCKPAGG